MTKQELTQREKQVADLTMAGLTSKIMAVNLGISRRTVEFHRQNILRKLGGNSQNLAVFLAERSRIQCA